MQPLEETLIRLRMSVSGLRDASYIASTYVEAIRGSGCDHPSDSINRAWLGLMLLGMIRVDLGEFRSRVIAVLTCKYLEELRGIGGGETSKRCASAVLACDKQTHNEFWNWIDVLIQYLYLVSL